MKVLRLFQALPTLPASMIVVVLAAVALVAFGGWCLGRRRVGRGLTFGAAGILVLWAGAALMFDEPAPPSAAEARRTMRIAAGVVGLCIAGGGAAALAGAIGMLRSGWRLVRRGVRVRGEIVDFSLQRRTGTDNERNDRYSAIVAFRTEEGAEHRFETDPWYRYQPDRGRRVKVLYDPGNPEGARLNSVFQLWGVPVFVGLMGLVFFAAGLAVVFVEPG